MNDDGYTKHFRTLANGKVVFVGMEPEHGEELWVTDGSESGTMVLDSIAPGSSSFPGLSMAPAVSTDGTLVYFSCNSESSGLGLCVTDGTLAGTRRIGGSIISGSNLVACGNGAFFTGSYGNSGNSLLYGDANSGITLVMRMSDVGGSIVSASGNAKMLTCAGNRIFFGVSTSTSGAELWMSDGTTAGTALVHEINTAPSTSGFRNPIGAIGNKFLFVGSGTTYTGQELWMYDPDASNCSAFDAATSTCVVPSNNQGRIGMVADIFPSETASGIVSYNTTSVGGRVFFQALDSTGNRELWSSNGTKAGTNVVYDFAGTSTAPNIAMGYSQGDSGRVYFSATRSSSNGNYGVEPHMFVLNPGRACSTFGPDFVASSDGLGCIGMIDDTNPTGSSTTTFYRATQQGVFFRSVGTTTSHLYWDHSSTPPFAYTVTTPADAGSTETADGILFSTFGTPPAPAVGGKRELWFSNGYQTNLVKEINQTTGSVGTNNYTPSSVTLGQKRYFVAWNQSTGSELWTSDGTPEGTVLVKNISPGLLNSGVTSLTAFNGVLYFVATDSTYESELWAYDPAATDCSRFDPTTSYGTSCATEDPSRVPGRIGVLKNINPSGGTEISNLTALGDTLYFSAKPSSAFIPWSTKGTAATTLPIHAVAAGPIIGANSFGKVGDLIVFSGSISALSDMYGFLPGTEATDAECVAAHGAEFRSATGGGCYKHLYNFVLGAPDISILGATNDGSKLFFTATENGSGRELYVTDGSAAGTVLVKDILPGSGDGVKPVVGGRARAFASNKFVFTAVDRYETNGSANQQIWITDGTSDGTFPISSSEPGFNARGLLVDAANSKVFFIAGSSSTGMELWTSDGTIAGTHMVKDVCPGACNGAISGPELGITLGINALGDGRVMLRGFTDATGTEPLVSDGTPEGTFLLQVAPGSAGSSPLFFWPLPNG